MVVWDARNKSDSLGSIEGGVHFSASSLGEPDLGHIIANNWLQWSVLEAARDERVTRFASELSAITLDAQAAQLSLSDGRRISARLVIGADGARSVSRECVGITTRVRPYQQTALVTHVRTARPHQQTAWQRFLPTGPIAFLPLNDGRSSIVWTTTPEHAAELLQMDEVALGQAIAAASDHVLGAVTLAAPRAIFPLQLAQVDEYCRHRFVLVGDAAHSMHPLAGQGVNLGFMDAASLVQVLSEARAAGASVEALSEMPVLRRYERWRKTENTAALGLVDAINRLFSNDMQSVGTLRRVGLRVIEQSPLAKRLLIQRALGLAGDRPAIVRQAY
jgi:2-octaprenylphenol hydroxylase